MTLRILAAVLLTTLASAQHPNPGAEGKSKARPAPTADSRPGERPAQQAGKPDGDVARARRLHALADLDGDGVISPRERQWVHMVLTHGEHAERKGEGNKGDVGEREPAKRAKEHAKEGERDGDRARPPQKAPQKPADKPASPPTTRR